MTLIQGDCVEVMRSMPEDSVDAVVTDPPAGISFMSKSWDSNKGGRRQWVAWFTEVMEEVLRVAKPGAHAFIWALPRTSHWTAWALEDAGWEIREVVHHIQGAGFPKSKNLGNGFGTALKPAAENWILCRAPLAEKSVTANFEEHGTGALNIDESRVGSEVVPTKGSPTGGRLFHRKHSHGKCLPTETLGTNTGRWPSNVVLSHSPECQRVGVKRVRPGNGGGYVVGKKGNNKAIWGKNADTLDAPGYVDPDGFEEVEAWECVEGCPVRLLDEQSGTLKSGGKKNASYSNENDGVFTPGGEQTSSHYGSEGGASRFFYCAKSSRRERTANGTVENGHPTVKSLALMRYLVKLVTPPGGVILDPFAGSGSTLVAATQEGFEAVGIEREAEYCEIAERRVAHARAELESQPLVLEV